MVIRSHRNRFRNRLTPRRIWRPRYPQHASATSLITETIPVSMRGWLFRMNRGSPNRTGRARRPIRLAQRRRRQRRKPHLRMAVRTTHRLFLPSRTGMHDGPVR